MRFCKFQFSSFKWTPIIIFTFEINQPDLFILKITWSGWYKEKKQPYRQPSSSCFTKLYKIRKTILLPRANCFIRNSQINPKILRYWIHWLYMSFFIYSGLPTHLWANIKQNLPCTCHTKHFFIFAGYLPPHY